jgi:hypothetical protein
VPCVSVLSLYSKQKVFFRTFLSFNFMCTDKFYIEVKEWVENFPLLVFGVVQAAALCKPRQGGPLSPQIPQELAQSVVGAAVVASSIPQPS